MESNRYPLDFEALDYGSRIEADEVERIIRQDSPEMTRQNRRYDVAIMKLCGLIERHFPDYHDNRECTARQDRDAIVIVPREGMKDWCIKTVRQGINKVTRAGRKAARIDRSGLTSEECADLDRVGVMCGMVTSCYRKERRKLAVKAHERQTPKLE